MFQDFTVGVCPLCGGRLCVDFQYPDWVFCDTCEFEYGSPS